MKKVRKKPPIGLMPEHIWNKQVQDWVDQCGGITMDDFIGFRVYRLSEIEKALARYEEAGGSVPWCWLREGGKLLSTGLRF